METISRMDFADERSRKIFEYRYAYYKSGSRAHILDMVIDEYHDFGMKVNSINAAVNERLQSFEGSFVIYGMGVHAGLTMDYLERLKLDDRFECFCVSDTEKEGCEGAICLKQLSGLKNKSMVLVPDGAYAAEMVDNLCLEGWDKEHFLVIPFSILFDKNYESGIDMKTVFNDADNHLIVYGTDWNNVLFRDLMSSAKAHFDFSVAEESRADLSILTSMNNVYVVVFNGLRKRKVLDMGIPKDKVIQLFTLDEAQYFDEEIVPKHIKGKREIFVDGGSLNLYSSSQFMRWCDYECDGIFAFEPDKRCAKICEDGLKKQSKLNDVTTLIPKGLWSKETELVFNEVGNCGSSSFVTHKGQGKEQVIPTTTIDIAVKGAPVTFIKMDIEGAELEALKGARETIMKYHPTLAISIYHKPEDIVELPEYIKSIVPEYKLYLRNYHQDHTETVLYAFYGD